MTKLKFITALNERLSHLPRNEVEERISFYIEAIEDRVEDGMSEEDAVKAIGDVDGIAAQIISEISPHTEKKETTKSKRRLKEWEIVLFVLCSPIWLSLLIAAFSVVISLYASLGAVIISLWSVFISLAAGSVAGLILGIISICVGYPLTGVALIGVSFVCAGMAILSFFACKTATNGGVWLVKKSALYIKKLFTKKEDA